MSNAKSEFRVVLNSFNENSRVNIRNLTIMAEDSIAHSSDIVQVIEERIFSLESADKMLLTLYVMDSIIKTLKVKPNIYIKQFSKNLIKVFVHAFSRSDEKIRGSLYKLRKTWDDFYSIDVLQALDFAVNKLDKNWPIDNYPTRIVPERKDDVQPKTLENTKNVLKQESTNKVSNESSNKVSDNCIENRYNHVNRRSPIMKSINEVNIGQKRPLPVTLAEGIDDFRKRRRQGPIVGNAPSLINVSTSLNNSVSVKRLNSPILPNGQGFTNSVPTMSNRHLASTLPQRIVAPALRAVATAPTLVIKSESPGVDGAQSNNRLFVDSKAYEVIYIGREPVIERGTLPHKVYFHGTPRNVFIDNIPYLLPFRESREIRIDNLTHLIRFGGPGRELFIGDFALNAKFGGPPITVNINGLTHSIKLEKPVPEVRIEPEPSYELLPELKKLQDSTSNAVFKDEGVKSFLLHLKNTGVIGVKTEPVPTPPLSVPPFQRQDPRVNNKPRTFHRNNVENKNVPAQISAPNSNDNNAQNTNDLSFEATLADLHASRNVCPNCGLQMNDSDTVMFSKHMDWHFRENSRILSQNNSGSTRPWNMTLETWLNFSEQQALVAPVVAEVQATETKEVDDTTNFVDALSADVEAQNCVICGEEFKEYFDDDDEEWKLQNCVVIDTIAYHRNCTGSLEGRNMVTNAQPTMSTVE